MNQHPRSSNERRGGGDAGGRTGARRNRSRCPDPFVRVPGLYRGWEVEDLLAAGDEILVEPGGTMDDGTPLHVVFRRDGGVR